jgi:AbrB family looped-hinge helix DNA binding protein
MRIIRDVAILRAAREGCIRVDGRDQIALPAGCRTVLGIKPGDRVVFAALPAGGVGLIYPMSAASGWIRARVAGLPEALDA